MARGEVTEKDDAQLFTDVLGAAVEVLEETGLPFATFGSVASNVYGRPGSSDDIDLVKHGLVAASQRDCGRHVNSCVFQVGRLSADCTYCSARRRNR